MSKLSLPSLSPRVTRARAVTVADLVPTRRGRAPLKSAIPRGNKRKRAGPALANDPPGPDIQFMDPHQQSVDRKMDLVLEALTEMNHKVRNTQRETAVMQETTASPSASFPFYGVYSRPFNDFAREITTVGSTVMSVLPPPDKIFNFQPISDAMDKLMRDKRAFIQLDLLLPQSYDLECSSDANTIIDSLAGAFPKLTGKGGGLLKRKVDGYASWTEAFLVFATYRGFYHPELYPKLMVYFGIIDGLSQQ